MKIAKKAGLIFVMVVSAILLIAMLGGIVGIWWFRGEAIQIGTNLTELGDNTLGRAQGIVAQLDQQVQTTQNTVNQLTTRIETAGANAAQTSLALTAAETIFDADLGPAVQQANARAQDIRDTAANLERTLALLQLASGGDSQLSGVGDSLVQDTTELGQTVTDLRQAIQTAKTSAVDQVVGVLTEPLNRASSRLAALNDRLDQITQRITQARVRLSDIRERLATTITLIVIGLTFLFLWLAVALFGLIIHAYGLFIGFDLLWRWHKGS